MSRNTLVIAAAAFAFAGSAFADVPDGRGGRIAPSNLNAPVTAAPAPHTCCNFVIAPAATDVVANPADLKAMGHVAWISRGDVAARPLPCYKHIAYRPAAVASPVEAKALGHVAARNIAPARRTCCDSGRCPMALKANASR
jgi:hypothetical protein